MIFQFGFFIWIIAGFLSATPLKKQKLKEEPFLEGIKWDKGRSDESVTDQISVVNSGLGLFEGDIMLIDIDKDKVDMTNEGDVDGGPSSDRYKRNVMRDKQALWSNREVFYEFHSSIPVSYHSTVMAAMDEFHLKTCLKFKPKTNQSNWILFIHKVGCWSTVGRKYWRVNYGQELSLGTNCNDKATVIHELMHAIGFWHEHSRTDRNQYVEVLWENIIEDKAHNFNKYKHDMIDELQVPYDYDSIMHYGRKQFSKNGEDTIRALHDPDKPLGNTQGFSPTDLHEINAMYDCKNAAIPGWSPWSSFGPCSLDCKKERQRYCFSDNPAVDCPGNHPYNVETETVVCSNSKCYAPVDGHWGRWSSWSNCTSCGPGSQKRTRQCDDPPPKNGGSNCTGNSTQSRACYLRRCGLGPDDCEFDYEGFCFWKNEKNSLYTFDWLRGTGATPSKNTGPTADHTTSTGHYLYIESSSPAQPGYKARIISKTFPPTSGRCLSFWYHMRGSSIGELNVYSQTKEGGVQKLWSRVGEQGSTWQLAQVSLFVDSNYELIFEAIRGKSFNGDIAIDDIKFQEVPCMESLGCFLDGSPRAIPEFLKNLRPDIDWYNMNKTIYECARLTHLKGYKIFGIQFYGECWSGDSSQVKYDKYGVAPDSQCWAGVGGPAAYFVYRIP